MNIELSDYEREIVFNALQEYDRQFCLGNIRIGDSKFAKPVLNMLIERFDKYKYATNH